MTFSLPWLGCCFEYKMLDIIEFQHMHGPLKFLISYCFIKITDTWKKKRIQNVSIALKASRGGGMKYKVDMFSESAKNSLLFYFFSNRQYIFGWVNLGQNPGAKNTCFLSLFYSFWILNILGMRKYQNSIKLAAYASKGGTSRKNHCPWQPLMDSGRGW